ncbi:MAG: glycoside hydrolase family 127 protein, partial [Oscillospiraceae bacterium]
RRMYITGGIGSSSVGEAFTVDYDLPNREAYSESCAAIGLALFARRMQLLDRDSRYADVIERILYNGFRSSMSLDGTAFFYENPLEILPQFNHKDTSVRERRKTRYPDTQRKRVFDCSCCPPNITRLIASVGDFLYTYEESSKTVYVHQYLDSSTRFAMAGVPVELKQTTRYPADGVVSLTVSSPEPLGLALRIPGWCRGEADLSVDGVPQQLQMKNGYAAVELTGGTHQITLAFAMAPQLVECSPHVAANAGRAALTLGPVVYCLEGVDNGEDLRELAILRDTDYEISYSQEWGCNLIQASGVRRNAEAFEQAGELYRPLGSSPYLRQELRFIPYYAFANRGETEMVVWIQVR